MLQDIRQKLGQSDQISSVVARTLRLAAGEVLSIRGLAGSMLAFMAAEVFTKRRSQLLLIASDEDRAMKLRDDCALLIGEGSVRFFGERPTHNAQSLDLSSSIAQIEALKAL